MIPIYIEAKLHKKTCQRKILCSFSRGKLPRLVFLEPVATFYCIVTFDGTRVESHARVPGPPLFRLVRSVAQRRIKERCFGGLECQFTRELSMAGSCFICAVCLRPSSAGSSLLKLANRKRSAGVVCRARCALLRAATPLFIVRRRSAGHESDGLPMAGAPGTSRRRRAKTRRAVRFLLRDAAAGAFSRRRAWKSGRAPRRFDRGANQSGPRFESGRDKSVAGQSAR